MNMKKQRTSDALNILSRRYYDGKPDRQSDLDRERMNAKIARDIHALRTKGGLTQKELAELIGTTPSVISRLESADYPGHSLSMLQRIAAAFNQRVEVKFIAKRTGLRGAQRRPAVDY
jgi:DNA-binding XRE family transcriptional regulator